VVFLLAAASTVRAGQEQHPPEHQVHPPEHLLQPSATRNWTWTTDANVFFGYNYQERKANAADFMAWESQNWFMLDGSRAAGPGRLTIQGMLSLEALTLDRPWGSPQLFQTGESKDQIPLANYQHPHDLLMNLGARYRIERPRVAYVFEADLVGSPSLGPTAFMHRESARSNPQVPLAHHSLDSTHISPGVLRAGVETRGFTFEASAFRGEEPDEHRLNIERPKLDSWAGRIGWGRGPWQAQVSGGRLHEPEWFEPYDETRVTASLGFTGTIGGRALAATAAWGENRHDNGFNDTDDSYLVEWDLRATSASTMYGRVERTVKQLLGLGLHPRGLNHKHAYSTIDALTLGYVRELPAMAGSRLGIGADVTLYGMSPDLVPFFEGSRSFHLFLRWRPAAPAAAHIH
jgi:hypothetical protein